MRVSADGKSLYVANARGRGAGPNPVGESKLAQVQRARHRQHHPDAIGASSMRTPRASTRTTASPPQQRGRRRPQVSSAITRMGNPIPSQGGKASSQIKHVIFINKENATHDLLLGDITQTREGVPVNGQPAFSLGFDASPNHHELALRFAFSDNFFLEPSVSSDGHRWLTGQYTTENEETHWPAWYGGRRQDSGDDPAVIKDFPGRIGFTDANASPEPNDLNEQGGIMLHLSRHGKSFVNFGNGFEFAVIDEPGGGDPTGAREHVNVPMEKVIRDNSDHLFPTFNTHIPTRRCRKIRGGSTATTASSRSSRRNLSIVNAASASFRSTWICTIRTITAAARATSTRTGPTGRSSGSCRTMTRRSA